MGVDIPPMPRGDPAGMRELAGICKSSASQLGSLGDDVTALPKSMTFEGTGAHRFGAEVQAYSSQLGDAAAQLQDLAGRLEIAATEVERLIAERNAAIQRAAEAMQASQGGIQVPQ